MKKFFYLFFVCNAFTQLLYSQKIKHSYGISLVDFKSESLTYSSSIIYLNYYPRINIAEYKNSSFSLALPIGIGTGITFVDKNNSKFSLAYSLPFWINYNVGCKSTTENKRHFGFYMGTGFEHSNFLSVYSKSTNPSGISNGIIYRVGFCFNSDKPEWKNQAMALGFYFKKGFENEQYQSLGFNMMCEL